jgi:hypothetical protein
MYEFGIKAKHATMSDFIILNVAMYEFGIKAKLPAVVSTVLPH